MISANIPITTRKAVYRRDGFRCAICDDTRYLQIHHYIHRSLGGTNHMHNLVCLCHKCHALAHGVNLFDADFLTTEEIEQAIVEYLADLYIDIGEVWNPYNLEPP